METIWEYAKAHYEWVLIGFGLLEIVGSILRWSWILEPSGKMKHSFLFSVIIKKWGENGLRAINIFWGILLILCAIVLLYVKNQGEETRESDKEGRIPLRKRTSGNEKKEEEEKGKKGLKFLYLVALGLWNVLLAFFLLPLIFVYFVGIIVFEERFFSLVSMQSILFLLLCFLSFFVLWKQRREYERRHLFWIIGLLVLLYGILKYSARQKSSET